MQGDTNPLDWGWKLDDKQFVRVMPDGSDPDLAHFRGSDFGKLLSLVHHKRDGQSG